MDYVYICRDGDNEELRYSIRSVIKNTKYDNIWVVGGKPDWYCGKHISVKQDGNPYVNVRNILRAICLSKDISENIVLMNDDFFIMKEINTFNNYNGGTLLDKIEKHQDTTGETLYLKRLTKTYNKLLTMDIKNPLNYELHVPILIEKSKLKRILKDIVDCSLRSVYGNLFLKNTEYIDDVKVYPEGKLKKLSYTYSESSIYLSSQDKTFITILPILKNKFDLPSIFEIN